MSKIKEASQFTNGAWSTPTPIGADDANIDITSATTNPTSDTTATSDGLVASDVTVSSGDTDAGAWTKFNRFRKRVQNSFGTLAGKTLATAYTTSSPANKIYSASVLNSYMSNVVGYTGTTAPSAGTVASQLSLLNSVENGLAIINSGNTATQNIPAGAYVWVKNNTNGISDGLYQNQGNIQISSGSTLAVGTGDGYITLVSDLLTTIYNSLNAIETYVFDAGSAYSTYFASSSNVTFKKVGRMVSVNARIVTKASMPVGDYLFAGEYTIPANMRPGGEFGFYIARADSGSEGTGTGIIFPTGAMKYGVNIEGVSGVVVIGTGLYIV